MWIYRALVGFAALCRIWSLVYAWAFQASALRSCSSKSVWMCQQLPGKQFVPSRCQRKGAPKAVEQLFLCAWLRKAALNWWLSHLIAAVLRLAMLYDRHKLLNIVQFALERTCWRTLQCVVSWVCTEHTLYCKVTLDSSNFILPLSQNYNKKPDSLTCLLMRDNVL